MLKFLLNFVLANFITPQEYDISSETYSQYKGCNLPEYNLQNESEIDKIISNMTLEEKVGQLLQINIGDLIKNNEIDFEKMEYYIKTKKIGSILNNLTDGSKTLPANVTKWIKTLNKMQNFANETRLKIPIVYGLDSVHGANFILNATLFPQQLGMASTFNLTLVEKIGSITAKDTRAVGVHWNFSPILDIAINKIWPRVYETFGEDPYLVSMMGKSIIKGYQGIDCDLSQKNKVAATMKHFIGYSNTKSGQDPDGSFMSERVVNEYFRPSFQIASDFGIATTMESYTDIDGDAIVNSKKFLNDLLRKQIKFDGMLITDFNQIYNLFEPIKVAKSYKDAIKQVMSKGIVDMSMGSKDVMFVDYLIELVNEGFVNIEILNNNVKRVLMFKKRLGLLEKNSNQISLNDSILETIGNDRNLSLDASRESIIMLKNNNFTLPLKLNSKILLTGPTANSLKYLTGGWSFNWQGAESDDWFFKRGTTIYEGVKQFTNNVEFIESVDINGNIINKFNINEFILKSTNYDYIILCLGEDHYAELNGNINDMNLPNGQNKLLEELTKKSKIPIILIINEGRPRIISNSYKFTNSILLNLLSGPESGQAISEILFGKLNPSGKLPLTYSNFVNLNNLNYYRKFNEVYNPEFEFGFGLSFSEFKLNNLILNNNIMYLNSKIEISVDITNISKIEGKEVVMVYVSDLVRSISPEVKKLKKFKKINLIPNETKTVKFNIENNDLSFYNVENKKIIEAGEFLIQIGKLNATFELKLEDKEFVYLN